MGNAIDKNIKRWLIVGAVLALITNALVFGWYVFIKSPPWSPLGPYPTQTIRLPYEAINLPDTSNQSSAAKFPTLIIKDGVWPDLPVKSEKCASETTNVFGDLNWTSVEPPGSVFDISDGATAIRVVGCTQFSYSNPVPDIVKKRIDDLNRQGQKTTLWRINGSETPIREGEKGLSVVWTTETFAIRVEP